MTAPVRFPRFFVTSPAPCPYLAGRTERKVFTELKGPHAEELNDALGRIGFSGWRRLGDDEQAALIAAATRGRPASPPVDGGSKDGTPGGQGQYKVA